MMMDVMARLGPRLLCGDVPKVRDACTTSVPVRRASVCAQHHSCRRAVTAYRLEAVCVCVCVSVEKVSYHARLSFGFLFNTALFAVVCSPLDRMLAQSQINHGHEQ